MERVGDVGEVRSMEALGRKARFSYQVPQGPW